ncbi:hypothetical protein [Roseateles chitinivorans]|uniref:hypothetical protein n=1 Tax=Roseateles chitinivorans TaxID=2917965 RepID=UPI003D6660FB
MRSFPSLPPLPLGRRFFRDAKHPSPHHGALFWLAHAAVLLGLLLIATEVSAQQGAGLRAQYDQLAPQLARSPFQKPIVLSSADDTERPTGRCTRSSSIRSARSPARCATPTPGATC